MGAKYFIACAASVLLLAGCVSPEEQRAMDQQQCSGYGFAPGSDAFANCLMRTSQQRDAQTAADRRAAAAQTAADQRARDAKDQADRDAWDRETHQGKYSSSSSSSADSATSPSSSSSSGSSMPDLSGMNCSSTSTTSGSSNNQTTTTHTTCRN